MKLTVMIRGMIPSDVRSARHTGLVRGLAASPARQSQWTVCGEQCTTLRWLMSWVELCCVCRVHWWERCVVDRPSKNYQRYSHHYRHHKQHQHHQQQLWRHQPLHPPRDCSVSICSSVSQFVSDSCDVSAVSCRCAVARSCVRVTIVTVLFTECYTMEFV